MTPAHRFILGALLSMGILSLVGVLGCAFTGREVPQALGTVAIVATAGLAAGLPTHFKSTTFNTNGNEHGKPSPS